MNKRVELHDELKNICPNVYFQAPGNMSMQYPAILYSIKDLGFPKASNINYKRLTSYDLTIVDEDPESPLVAEVLNTFTYAKFDRHFVSDGLNHFVIQLYY